MGRPLRNTAPEKEHFLTLRTWGEEHLMRPSREVNEIIGGIIAKYQAQFDIEINAFEFLSNHYHQLCRAPKQNLWRFAQAVNREIAKRLNWHLGRKGNFWSRRYTDQIVIEEVDAVEALLYIITNSVHHGLVNHPRNWPGLSCYPYLDGKRKAKFKFTNYTLYSKMKSRGFTLEDCQTEHEIKLTPLPYFKGCTLAEQFKKLEPLIEKRVAEIAKLRQENGQGFLGRQAVLRQDPFSRPQESKHSPCPPCYTKSASAKAIFLQTAKAVMSWYREASHHFRKGNYLVEFPPFTIKPPLHYVPT